MGSNKALTDKEREMLDHICTRILNEKSSDNLNALMEDLNTLLQQIFGPLSRTPIGSSQNSPCAHSETDSDVDPKET